MRSSAFHSHSCAALRVQVFHPDKFQEHVLGQRGEDTMIQAPKQLAFTDFYMPATAELTKDVFAEETSGTITQGLAQEGGYTGFCECLGVRRSTAAVLPFAFDLICCSPSGSSALLQEFFASSIL